jgi:hypothetical protein
MCRLVCCLQKRPRLTLLLPLRPAQAPTQTQMNMKDIIEGI